MLQVGATGMERQRTRRIIRMTKSKEDEMGRVCNMNGGKIGMHIGYGWKSQKKKKATGRPRRRLVDNIKIDLRDIDLGGWTGLSWLQWRALVKTVINLRVLQNFGKIFSRCATGCFSRRVQLHCVNFFVVTKILPRS
jgi:hypothetical protein